MQKRGLYLLWILPIFWMGAIFMLSHQPSEESAQLSSQVVEVIEEIVSHIEFDISRFEIHKLVRKSAHFLSFFILGILLFIPLYVEDRRLIQAGLKALGIGCWYAVLDETHQLFVVGRSFQVTDILIDSSGILIAVLLSILVCYTKVSRGRVSRGRVSRGRVSRGRVSRGRVSRGRVSRGRGY